MSGVELIAGALAAGAATGITNMASGAIDDANRALRGLLSARFAGRKAAGATLNALDTETDPAVLAERLGADLVESGAVADEQIIEAARRLAELARRGSTTFVVGTNNGAVGEFHAPVTFSAPHPSSPGTA